MQHGLVPKRPSAPPQGATTGRDTHVDEVDGHQAARHRHLGEVADAAEVVRIGQRHDAAARFCAARAMPSSIACTPTTWP